MVEQSGQVRERKESPASKAILLLLNIVYLLQQQDSSHDLDITNILFMYVSSSHYAQIRKHQF